MHFLNNCPVCDFQSMKITVELNSLSQKSFAISPGLLYHLIRRDTGRLEDARPVRQILLFLRSNSLAV